MLSYGRSFSPQFFSLFFFLRFVCCLWVFMSDLMYSCEPHTCRCPQVRRGHWIPQELELLMVMDHHMGGRHMTWVFLRAIHVPIAWVTSPAPTICFKLVTVMSLCLHCQRKIDPAPKKYVNDETSMMPVESACSASSSPDCWETQTLWPGNRTGLSNQVPSYDLGWKDGSVIKSLSCSSRGPEFASQHPHHVAHNCLYVL